MSKLIPTLFFQFEVELTNPKAELKETCWYARCLVPWPSYHNNADLASRWFVKQEGLFVTLRPRSKVQ